MEEKTAKIKKATEDLLTGLQVDHYVSVEYADNSFNVAVDSPHSGILIGWHGETLQALQYVVRMLNQDVVDYGERITLDVNNYKDKQRATLQNLATKAAQEVKYTGQEVQLRPMSAYERKIVHAALSNESDITTESIGEDPNRKIVIKPKYI